MTHTIAREFVRLSRLSLSTRGFSSVHTLNPRSLSVSSRQHYRHRNSSRWYTYIVQCSARRLGSLKSSQPLSCLSGLYSHILLCIYLVKFPIKISTVSKSFLKRFRLRTLFVHTISTCLLALAYISQRLPNS